MACGEGVLNVTHTVFDCSVKGNCKYVTVKKDAELKLDGTLRLYEGRVTLNPYERGSFSVGSKAKRGTLKWVRVDPE